MDLGFIKNRTIKLRKIIEGFNNEFIFFLPKKHKGNEHKRDKYKELFLTDVQNQFKIIISNGIKNLF